MADERKSGGPIFAGQPFRPDVGERLMNEKAKPDWFFRVIVGFVVAVIAFSIFGCVMSVRQSAQFARDCDAAGGYVYDAGKDWLCLDRDGRVIVP